MNQYSTNSLLDKQIYTLYGIDASYFTMKVLCGLRWSGLKFEYKLKSSDIKKDLEVRSGTQQMPVLATPEGWLISDSTPIFQLIDSRLENRLFYPKGITGSIALVLEEYLNEWISRTALHYRWNYEESREFAKVKLGSDLMDSTQKSKLDPEKLREAAKQIGEMVSMWGDKAVKATGVYTSNQQKSAEIELERLLVEYEKHLSSFSHIGQSSPRFLLGEVPCGFDATLFGAFEAHFYLDPVPRSRLYDKKRFPHFINSYEFNLSQGKSSNLSSFFSNKKHTILDVNHLPLFVDFLLKEISNGPFSNYLLQTRNSVLSNKKSFVINSYNEDVSYFARKYVHHSLNMLNNYNSIQLGQNESTEFNNLMKKYKLDFLFFSKKSSL